jgi:hypothetical protein
MVRAREAGLEYLVLGDSPVILKAGDHVMPVADDRVDHLQPGGRPYTRALVRSKRNAPGGFWVASTNLRAAYEARSGTADCPAHAVLLTDGVTRLVDHYGYGWAEIFAVLDRDGPTGLIHRVREAERISPPLCMDTANSMMTRLSSTSAYLDGQPDDGRDGLASTGRPG